MSFTISCSPFSPAWPAICSAAASAFSSKLVNQPLNLARTIVRIFTEIREYNCFIALSMVRSLWDSFCGQERSLRSSQILGTLSLSRRRINGKLNRYEITRKAKQLSCKNFLELRCHDSSFFSQSELLSYSHRLQNSRQRFEYPREHRFVMLPNVKISYWTIVGTYNRYQT